MASDVCKPATRAFPMLVRLYTSSIFKRAGRGIMFKNIPRQGAERSRCIMEEPIYQASSRQCPLAQYSRLAIILPPSARWGHSYYVKRHTSGVYQARLLCTGRRSDLDCTSRVHILYVLTLCHIRNSNNDKGPPNELRRGRRV